MQPFTKLQIPRSGYYPEIISDRGNQERPVGLPDNKGGVLLGRQLDREYRPAVIKVLCVGL